MANVTSSQSQILRVFLQYRNHDPTEPNALCRQSLRAGRSMPQTRSRRTTKKSFDVGVFSLRGDALECGDLAGFSWCVQRQTRSSLRPLRPIESDSLRELFAVARELEEFSIKAAGLCDFEVERCWL